MACVFDFQGFNWLNYFFRRSIVYQCYEKFIVCTPFIKLDQLGFPGVPNERMYALKKG